jgi:uncharacterized protein (TIGR02284 family)
MTTASEHAVKVLNSLIETTLDSAEGYREAAEATENPSLKTMFGQRAMRRKQLTGQLQAEVRTFGGEPDDDGSILAKAHRIFLDLQKTVTGGSEKSVIDEVERGEDFIKAKYEKAAQDRELPQVVSDLIREAFATIKADHDEVSLLKRSMH